MLATRPDLEVAELRGNVDTRLAKLDAGEYDAIILASAGLERLGLGDRITARLEPPDWLPAGTQGIIGLQCREGDQGLFDAIAPLADADAMRQAEAERTVLAALQGSCQVPLAVYAELLGPDDIRLTGMVGSPDGRRILRAREQGADPRETGLALAQALRNQGAEEIIAALTEHQAGA